jgi:primosomal replication protein N
LNQLELTGTLIAIEPVRYTPGGIAVVNLTVQHASEQFEAGSKRQVTCEVQVIVAGDHALLCKQARLGECYRLKGFLAAKGKSSKALVLHATEFNFIEH